LASTASQLPNGQPAVKGYVLNRAKELGVNPIVAAFIVSHESQWDPTKTGDDGNSRGLWQISSIWHPEVSDACAYNVECSTNWSLEQILHGHIEEWSTWRFRCKWYAKQDPPDC
jgi:hypothetical protein